MDTDLHGSRAFIIPGVLAAAPALWTTLQIAGHTAKEHGGSSVCNFKEAVTVVDGRAYVFTATPNRKQCCHSTDPDLFDAFLATIRFPGDAAAAPSAASS